MFSEWATSLGWAFFKLVKFLSMGNHMFVLLPHSHNLSNASSPFHEDASLDNTLCEKTTSCYVNQSKTNRLSTISIYRGSVLSPLEVPFPILEMTFPT